MDALLERNDQAADDPELLELLLKDLEASPAAYRPTPYWAGYLEGTVEYLRTHGLKDFRRTTQGFLPSFGATDLPFSHSTEVSLSRAQGLTPEQRAQFVFCSRVAEANPTAPLLPGGFSMVDLHLSAYRMSELMASACGASSIANIEASRVGNPAAGFDIEGRFYTHSFLYYYWRYLFLARHLDFGRIDSVVELGSGAGKQTEVLKKLYPHLTFYLLDLAPQIYVASQYLKAVFPGDVVDYRENRGKRDLRTEGPGKIVVLSNEQIEHLAPEGTTLFWNAASFGEMEPDVVANYLAHAQPYSEAIYLYQCAGGKERQEPGRVTGVVEPVVFENYESWLARDYALVDRAPAFSALRRIDQSGGYDEALWVKPGDAGARLLRTS